MADPTQTTETVSITIDADGNGWTQIPHAPSEVSSPVVSEGTGTASLTPVEGQPDVTCINVVQSTPSSTVTVSVTVTQPAVVDASEDAQATSEGEQPAPLASAVTDGEQAAQSADAEVDASTQDVATREEPNAAEQAHDEQLDQTAEVETQAAAAEQAEVEASHEHDFAASDHEPAGQSDAGPQNGGVKASEDAGTGDQAGSPSEEPSELAKLLAELDEDFDLAKDGADLDKLVDLLGEQFAGKVLSRLQTHATAEGTVKCPVCQFEFVPGEPHPADAAA